MRPVNFPFPPFVYRTRQRQPYAHARVLLSKLPPHGQLCHGAGEETPYAREVAEAALAHVIGDKAEQAYRRGDALEKRRALMKAWADYFMGRAAANVVPLRAESVA